MENPARTGYHDLLPLHHAMQLRRRIMSPARGSAFGGAGTDEVAADYDGTADQHLILRNLDLVMPLEGVVEQLYIAMFHRRPHLKSMFPDSMGSQRERLAQALLYLVEHLHRPEVVGPAFERLGSEHRKLGVRAAHYPTFETALFEALRIRAGRQWTAELEGAWTRMLRFAIDAMIAGAAADVTAPPYWRAEVIGHERRRLDLAVLRVVASEPYAYRAGQYGTIQSALLPHAWRPYGIACAPRQDNVLEFHIRQSGMGGVSEALVRRTSVGDTLRLGPANGVMTLREDLPDRDLLLVAADTGLAPIKAMLEELARADPGSRRVHLFVTARSRAELYDRTALAEAAERHRWLEVVPVIVDDRVTASADSDPMAEALGRHGDWSGHVVFVSGAAGMVDATISGLIRMNVPVERIRYEPAVRRNRADAHAETGRRQSLRPMPQ